MLFPFFLTRHFLETYSKFTDALYLPLILYSDETEVKRARGGKQVHPVRIVPAHYPLDLRLKDSTKITIGYITDGADTADAWELFCKLNIYVQSNCPHFFHLGSKMAELEDAAIYIVDGKEVPICAPVLLWLVDHSEGNKLLQFTPLACRSCVKSELVAFVSVILLGLLTSIIGYATSSPPTLDAGRSREVGCCKPRAWHNWSST